MQLDKNIVAENLEISIQRLIEIESGSSPLTDKLTEFYAQSLRIKTKHLDAILFSKKGDASIRPANRVLNKYLEFVIDLKQHKE